ncbi:MAG: SDR family NAD(P)-dependent oxidoreductase [Clostridia bacterium]|nr:SDR family NAD(P)-dependent oxidoreductase [Clostridia bacterium]
MLTLITGASGYLGKAFCRLCLENGDDLVVTGRSVERLEALKEELTAAYHGAKIECHAADLTDSDQRAALFGKIEGYKFSLAINCAGADIQKAVERFSEKSLTFAVRANFEAAASVCLFAVKHRAEELRIINISSVCGLYPMPYFALYSASKGALTSFSLSLSRETKGTGVYVTAVLPGAFYSRPDVVEYIKKEGAWGRLSAKTPEFVAKKALGAAKRHKKMCVPGAANRLMNFFTRLVPAPVRTNFIARRWKKTEKDGFFPEERL